MKKLILATAILLVPVIASAATIGFKGYSALGTVATTCYVTSGKANVDGTFAPKDITAHSLARTGTSTFTVDYSVDYKITCVQTAAKQTAATALLYTDGVGTNTTPITTYLLKPYKQ